MANTNRIPVMLGTALFPTLTSCRDFFQRMLRSYKRRGRLKPSDERLFLELVKRHPSYGEYSKAGIACVHVVFNQTWGSKCFALVMQDGALKPVSLEHCISYTRKADVLTCMREEVTEYITAARDEAFRGGAFCVCAVTGKLLSRHEARLDHQSPLTFNQLVFDFLKSKGLTLNDIQCGEQGVGSKNLADRTLADEWKQYYRTHAIVRIMDAKEQRKQPKPEVDFSELERSPIST